MKTISLLLALLSIVIIASEWSTNVSNVLDKYPMTILVTLTVFTLYLQQKE